MITRISAYPRATFIGNSSTGYSGKTVAFTFSDFHAEAVLFESPEIRIEPGVRDDSVFESADSLVYHITKFGYYGGIRLVKASIRCFHDYVVREGIELPRRNFTIRYSSSIPDLVGLAGSSAIVTACLRALLVFYEIEIPPPVLATLVRDVEEKELGIPAGLQDRVVQVYQGLVCMDFDREIVRRNGHGRYETISPDLLPPLYIAYRTDLSGTAGVFHNEIRERFEAGDREVIGAMEKWAEISEIALEAMKRRDYKALGETMDEDFSLCARFRHLHDGDLQMGAIARECGASAKLSGSGGAIVGICPDDETYARLRNRLGVLGVKVLRPKLAQ